MNWSEQAKKIFRVPKPEHFTNYRHCGECFQHDEVLRAADVDTIGLKELGNAAWDPMVFISPEGFKYYLPALVRLTLSTIDNFRESYLDQFLQKLILDGMDNRLVTACSRRERQFIASFLEFLIENYPREIEQVNQTYEVFRAYEIWKTD